MASRLGGALRGIGGLDSMRRRPVVFTDRHGLRYELQPGENARVYFEHDGNYEVEETRFCEQWLRPGNTALDIGANIGLSALLFAKLVGPAGRVVAFEPDPANHQRLVSNLALNGFDNVTPERLAVFEAPGTLTLNRFRSGLGPWSSLGRPELPDPNHAGRTTAPVDAVLVEAVALDDYCAARGIERVRLLKVDVESAELDVLKGAQSLLGRHAVEAVLFEVSLPQTTSLGHAASQVFAFLASSGYVARPFLEEGGLGDPVADADARYGNYLALPER